MAKFVGRRQALDAPASGQVFAHKILAPHLIEALCGLERYPLIHRPCGLPTLVHGQIDDAVDPIHALMIHVWELQLQ
jgi:hypothetical protein